MKPQAILRGQTETVLYGERCGQRAEGREPAVCSSALLARAHEFTRLEAAPGQRVSRAGSQSDAILG
jgi:hypothetical protein